MRAGRKEGGGKRARAQGGAHASAKESSHKREGERGRGEGAREKGGGEGARENLLRTSLECCYLNIAHIIFKLDTLPEDLVWNELTAKMERLGLCEIPKTSIKSDDLSFAKSAASCEKAPNFKIWCKRFWDNDNNLELSREHFVEPGKRFKMMQL